MKLNHTEAEGASFRPWVVFSILLLLCVSVALSVHAETILATAPLPVSADSPLPADKPSVQTKSIATADTVAVARKTILPSVSVNLQDIEIRELVRILGQSAGVTIYADPSVTGTASLNVVNLSFEEALRVIVEPRGYVYQRMRHGDRPDSFGYFIYDPAASRRIYIADDSGMLTVDIQRFGLSDVLAEIARETHRSIVAIGAASTPITLSLQALPFEKALGEVARAGGAQVVIAGEGDSAVYRVIAIPAVVAGASGETGAGVVAATTATLANVVLATPYEVTKLEGGRLKIRASQAPLKDVLAAIAEAGGLSVVIGPEVSGATTSYFGSSAPVDAIQSLASQAGLRVFTQNDVLVVATAQANQLTVQTSNDRLSILAYDAPVREALTRVALAGSLPALTFDPSVDGTVSLRLVDKKPREALDRIAEARGFRVEERSGTLRVTDPAHEKRNRIVVIAGLVSMDVQNSPFQEVLKEFGVRTGFNVTSAPFDTPISISVQSLPAPASLRAIADAVGLTVAEDADRFRLVPRGAPATGLAKVHIAEGLLNIECADAQITLLAQALAAESGKNFLIETGVTGSITGKIEGVPFEAGLRTFLASKGYRLRKSSDIYRITTGATPSGTEQTANFEVSVDSGRVTLDVTEADLGALLRQIAEEAGMNLALYGTVRDKINVIIRNEPLESALGKILAGTRFGYTIADSTLTVGDISQAGPMAAMALHEEIIPLKYFSAKEVPALLPAEIPGAQVKVIEAQNAILVTGRQEIIDRARKFLARLDRKPTQIQIEGLLVEYRNTKDFTYNLSSLNIMGTPPGIANISPSAGALGFTLNNIKNFNNPQFQAALTALVERGDASIRARPSIATISGREALVTVQSTENFRTAQPTANVGVPLLQITPITSGIKLRITPYVSADAGDAVTVDIFIEDSSPGDRSADGLPAIASRNAQNRMILRSDHTAVIGGLIRNDVSNNHGGFPILSQIPVIGGLFGHMSTSDRQSTLVFYLTPRIITSDTTVAESFVERGAKVEPEALGLPVPVPELKVLPLPAQIPTRTSTATSYSI